MSTTSNAPHPEPLCTLSAFGRETWTPIHTLRFPSQPSTFFSALLETFSHPEHNTTWILRSDTLYDSSTSTTPPLIPPLDIALPGFTTTRTLLRRFVPRNPQRDNESIQTCHFLSSTSLHDDAIRELVLLLTHSPAGGVPYYLPQVRGVAWLLHHPTPESPAVSLLYNFFPLTTLTPRLSRTAEHLLTRVLKLSKGTEEGYEKRVHHDVLVKRETFQDLYLSLRLRHAKRLVEGWREKTDPTKHVFEDILIAAFLLCLWGEMYPDRIGWRGFVDVGCGNGVLVDILIREGWGGYGFDARARKSWDGFQEETRARLRVCVLVPWLLDDAEAGAKEEGVHDGRFEDGTFIISNHADELTPWTPILAAANKCPFLAIPCCSHDLSGAKKRFPPPKEVEESNDLRLNRNYSKSTYASLCGYVERLAGDCGWAVEREVLRIPSTRNMGIIGRRVKEDVDVDVREIVQREGGGVGWRERVEALRKKEAVGH
jgi:tRNASer (uridine44-2'-O)-methyltransferase